MLSLCLFVTMQTFSNNVNTQVTDFLPIMFPTVAEVAETVLNFCSQIN